MLLDLKKSKKILWDIDVLLIGVIHFLEYIKNYMFLPGQVENWVVIGDLNKLSLSELPRKEMSRIIWVLQNNYRSTLGKAWIVRCTGLQKLAWNIIELFIEEDTREKVNLSKESNPKEMSKWFHSS